MYKRTDWGHIRVNEIDEYIDALVYPIYIVLPEEIRKYITCSCGGHEGYQDYIDIGFKVPDISIIENFVSDIRKGLKEQYYHLLLENLSLFSYLQGPSNLFV
jgi:hypothetical protein